jgi:hypothetical protein
LICAARGPGATLLTQACRTAEGRMTNTDKSRVGADTLVGPDTVLDS